MNLDWRPEPTPEEREARDPRGAWWREGVQESLAPDHEPDP